MSLRAIWATFVVASAASPFAASTNSRNGVHHPLLEIVETTLRTTAKSDFGGHPNAFKAAAAWNGNRLRASSAGRDEQAGHPRAPHLCCADYEDGREAYSLLQDLLSPEAVRFVAHSEEGGACYFVTASHRGAAAIAKNQESLKLRTCAPFPSALKVAPGLLEHGHDNGRGRLSTRHGAMMRKGNVKGLSVELAPGTLPADSWKAGLYIEDLVGDLLSESIDLHATNFWSDLAMAKGEHLATSQGAVRGKEWSKAATVVHELSGAASTSPGDICSWNHVRVLHAGDDLVLVSGLDHLLPSGRGAGGTRKGGEAAELQVACFMGLVSFLAGRLEVLRVASTHTYGPLNAEARANVQSATITDTPLTDAGLDGTGQVIQIIDTGLDESSCFFAHDETGDHIAHGYYFDELGANFISTYSFDDDWSFFGDDDWWNFGDDWSFRGGDDDDDSSLSDNDDSLFSGGDDSSLSGNDDSSLVGNDDSTLFGKDDSSFSGDDDWAVLDDDAWALSGDDAWAVLDDDAWALSGDDDWAVLDDDAWAFSGDDDWAVLDDDAWALSGDDDWAVLDDDAWAFSGDDDWAVLDDDAWALSGDDAWSLGSGGSWSLSGVGPDSFNPEYLSGYTSESQSSGIFTGGDFSAFPNRRKVVQYINLVKSDDIAEPNDGSFTSDGGNQFPWLPADEFEYDYKAGHGTHTAGSAAGATLNNPAELVTCAPGKVVSCVGGCVDETGQDDDLVASYAELVDLDRLCPAFGCDDAENPACLGDDVGETLTKNGGVAQGAKLAIFDVFYRNYGLVEHIGNGLWEPCVEAGCKVHSNSWGADNGCEITPMDLLYDAFMYENPENLLIFAAGNAGQRPFCTVGSPATAKNTLAVGATMSGHTRYDLEDVLYQREGQADIDTVTFFSSSGPTLDGRIKPEVVAPGDMIYSAASDGEEEAHSCRLWAFAGTSMSCPIVAGASAMVRQYFMESEFYAADLTARGFCGDWAGCEALTPSSATMKALLINSANLMGESSEPDGSRGFGRVHLEAGMPLAGAGSLALFVADAVNTAIPELTRVEYNFDVDADAGLDFRATLSWIDPPSTSFTSKQLVHDLDLAVVSPSGVRYTMWSSGEADEVNVNERVIVDAADVETGVWSVWVSANRLAVSDEQSYSLVVNGAISPATGIGAAERSSSSSAAGAINSASPSDSDAGLSGDEEVVDGGATGEANDDDASVIGNDTSVADDDGGRGVGDDATGDDAGATTVDDDAGVAVGGMTSSQSTLGEGEDSSGVTASSPSAMLTVCVGLFFVTAAPFLAVSL